MRRWILGLCFLIWVSLPTTAQSATPVEVTAPDGLVLKGDWYLVDAQRPTVLLLHQLYANRTSWNSYIGTLTGAGFNVLAVDLRGHGQTRGRTNWGKALDDVAVWTSWLRNTAGVRGDAISMMGSSIGSALAIVGCGRDSACRTAIAISPGWSYYGIAVEGVLKNELQGRQILIIYAQRDRFPALGVPRMVAAAPQVIVEQKYAGNTHGMNLLSQQADTAVPAIVNWLAQRGG
jgi:pimeloyl-ACP methyl ester carboxylesterase